MRNNRGCLQAGAIFPPEPRQSVEPAGLLRLGETLSGR